MLNSRPQTRVAPLVQKHMPHLDVLRGLAIGSVLIYHGIYWSQPVQPGAAARALTRITLFGWLGVNLFFVLSGFLITGILLDSKEKPSYFSHFYIRRALRILPAYLLTIAALIILHMLSWGGVLSSLTFLTNYSLIPAKKMYGVFWSLSVEEQFYLIWPLIVLICGRRTLTCIAVGMCILEPLLRAAVSLHSPQHDALVHMATFMIGDNLALGALAAIFVRSRYATRRNFMFASVSLIALAACIFLCAAPLGILHRDTRAGAALQPVPFDLIFAAALLGGLAGRPLFFNRPAFSPLRGLGDISYGLYLVHLMIFASYDRVIHASADAAGHGPFYGHFGLLLVRFVICASISIILAWLSRRFYEESFLRLKDALAPSSTTSRMHLDHTWTPLISAPKTETD